MKTFIMLTVGTVGSLNLFSQVKWTNVDSLYQPLPSSLHIYFSDSAIDTAVFRAYYLIADLKDKKLDFTVDTTLNRRLTPSQFYEGGGRPVVVVNCTFFAFETNRNLNVVIKEGKMLAYNVHTVAGRGKDTLTYRHPFGSAIGISKKRKADIAWLFTDSSTHYAYATQVAKTATKDSTIVMPLLTVKSMRNGWLHERPGKKSFHKWAMQTAIGGGPVALQHGEIVIANEEELKFTGKAINDKHPRTAMGYTRDDKLIILVIEGRNSIAHGATLQQEAQILKDLACIEALNLDGGGSSCMLVNGKETIKPSDKEGQRAVPTVFMIRQR